MSNTVIKVENVSKQYRLGIIGTGTLKDDLNRLWYTLRGKDDPYLKIGEINDRARKSSSEYVWALSNISFEVKQGDVVGIIGKNGAGKSTLLKILSRTTLPTTGSVKVKGRIASLLEVGTGFHPDLTGRENVFLNGAILGMTKAEIKSKFDEIVDFSGVERYIDTPVKRYSSGMYVRLAFAVAAHLEPEILIVDEVLAVGDAEFQKKALGKMKDVSQGQGRTVLFVSHSMPAFSTLCNRGIVINNGSIQLNSTTKEAMDYYIQNLTSSNFKNDLSRDQRKERRGNGDIRIVYVETFGADNSAKNEFTTGENIVFKFRAIVNRVIEECSAMIVIKDGQTGISIASTEKIALNKSYYNVNEVIDFKIVLPNIPLQQGSYNMKFWLGQGISNYDVLDDNIKPLVITNPIGSTMSGLGSIHISSLINLQ